VAGGRRSCSGRVTAGLAQRSRRRLHCIGGTPPRNWIKPMNKTNCRQLPRARLPGAETGDSEGFQARGSDQVRGTALKRNGGVHVRQQGNTPRRASAGQTRSPRRQFRPFGFSPRADLDKGREEVEKEVTPEGPLARPFHSTASQDQERWKTSLENLEFMLMEDNPVDANPNVQIAGHAMECHAGLLSGPATTPLTAPRGAGDAVGSDWPRAWGGLNAPTDCRSAGDPAPRNRRAPAARAPNPEKLLPCGAREVPRAGGAVDFERLYQMHSRRVYRLCRRMAWDKADAEDLTQEVFLQLFRKIDTFRGESAFTTWLTRVTVNVVLMQHRKKSRTESPLGEGNELGEPSAPSAEELGDPGTAPLGVIDPLDLERAMSELPLGYSRVFSLHDVEGYAHTEIAQMLGISAGTSKSQLHKARLRLRHLLRRGGSRYLQTEQGRMSRNAAPKALVGSRVSRSQPLVSTPEGNSLREAFTNG